MDRTGGLRDRRVKKTDQAIFGALQDLSENTPISQITVSAVAREANITRKTFYDHYPTVIDAYQEMLASIVEEVAVKTENDWKVIAQTKEEYSTAEELETRLMLFLGNVRELIEEHSPGSRRRNRWITQDEQIAYLIKPFTKHVKNGLLGDAASFGDETDLVAEFVLAGMLWMYRRWLSDGIEGSFYDAQQRVCKLIMNGLSSFQ